MLVSAPFVVPPLLLALVLLVSAVFKLRDPQTTQDAFVSLRLPEWLRGLNAPVVLPYLEVLLVIGLVFVPAPAYLFMTVVATLVFVAYLVVVCRALTFDEPVDCGCFGRLGLGEVDRRTALRNALLVVLALIAVGDAATGRSVIHRLVEFGAPEWAWLAGVASAIVLTGLVLGRPRDKAAQGPATDALDYERDPIPYGALRDRSTGEAVPLQELGRGRPALLVFLKLTCGPCARTMEALPEWAGRHTIIRTIAVPLVPDAQTLPDLGPHVTWMDDPSTAVARTFGVGYPSAVLLGVDGLLAGGPESGFEEIRDFLREISQQLSDAGIAPDGVPHDAEEVDADPPSPVQSSSGREA